MGGRAIATWYPTDSPPPVAFNRHVSAHRLSPDQYTEHNALTSLMLVAPFVRELDYLTKLVAAEQQDDSDAA